MNNDNKFWVSHNDLGLNSSSMRDWFSNKTLNLVVPKLLAVKKPIIHKQIPSLRNYDCIPDEKFWSIFPSCPLPNSVHTPIDTDKLKDLIMQYEENLSPAQIKNAYYVLHNLRFGADNLTDNETLKSFTLQNSPSMYKQKEVSYLLFHFTTILKFLYFYFLFISLFI